MKKDREKIAICYQSYLVVDGSKSKWVWSGNTTITHCRRTHRATEHWQSQDIRNQIKAKQPALSASPTPLYTNEFFHLVWKMSMGRFIVSIKGSQVSISLKMCFFYNATLCGISSASSLFVKVHSIKRVSLWLQVSSADDLCKQFGPRSGPTKSRAWSGSKLFDYVMTLMSFWFWGYTGDIRTKLQAPVDTRIVLLK